MNTGGISTEHIITRTPGTQTIIGSGSWLEGQGGIEQAVGAIGDGGTCC